MGENNIPIKIYSDSGCFLGTDKNKYTYVKRKKLYKMFLPFKDFNFTEDKDNYKMTLSSISQDGKMLDAKHLNIFISIENCPRWPWYKHFNEYGEYKNEKIDIFLYNHISERVIAKYLAIPTIDLRINYYLGLEQENYFAEVVPFNQKKFCLLINKSGLNNDIGREYVSILKHFNNSKEYEIDHISKYNDKILHESCYNSKKLLKVFSQYKFIICFENSYADGYITEKIFNVFLSRSIPIYRGSPIASKYFCRESFIDANDEDHFNVMSKLVYSEENYNKYLYNRKITEEAEKYSLESVKILKERIGEVLIKKNLI